MASETELVKTLPTTFDGVRVGLLMFVWAATGNRYCVVDGCRAAFDPEWDTEAKRRIGDADYLRVCECFSTPDAAKAYQLKGGE